MLAPFRNIRQNAAEQDKPLVESGGLIEEDPYVDDRQHGHWVWLWPDGILRTFIGVLKAAESIDDALIRRFAVEHFVPPCACRTVLESAREGTAVVRALRTSFQSSWPSGGMLSARRHGLRRGRRRRASTHRAGRPRVSARWRRTADQGRLAMRLAPRPEAASAVRLRRRDMHRDRPARHALPGRAWPEAWRRSCSVLRRVPGSGVARAAHRRRRGPGRCAVRGLAAAAWR